jgi:hypothetical protein
MDASKQVIGSVLVHIANLLLSMLSSGTFTTEPVPSSLAVESIPKLRLAVRQVVGIAAGDDDDSYDQHHSNPCSFYLLNLGIDVCIASGSSIGGRYADVTRLLLASSSSFMPYACFIRLLRDVRYLGYERV